MQFHLYSVSYSFLSVRQVPSFLPEPWKDPESELWINIGAGAKFWVYRSRITPFIKIKIVVIANFYMSWLFVVLGCERFSTGWGRVEAIGYFVSATRGVPRLDGTRGKKQVWRPHVRTHGLLGPNVVYWRKYFRRCNGNGLLFHMTQPISRSTIKAIACSKPTISEH